MARVALSVAAALLLPPAAARAAAPDLTGTWQKSPASALERYAITPGGASQFAVACLDSCGWRRANITAVDAVNLQVVFDNGASHGGSLAASGASIAWADGSGWARMRPAGDAIVVHVSPSVHMDPGWMDTETTLYRTLFKPSIANVTAALLANPNRTHVPEVRCLAARAAAWRQVAPGCSLVLSGPA